MKVELLPIRIASKIEPEPTSGCWLWTAYRDRDGYGGVRAGGRWRHAHRVVYELLVGAIPRGLELDHVKARGCTSRACVNPDHLEPVTHLVNVQRDLTGDGPETHCPHGHPYDEENTRRKPGKGWRECRICNRERSRLYEERRPPRHRSKQPTS